MKIYSNRSTIFACIACVFLIDVPAFSQIEEPIFTKSAQVFGTAEGSLKLDYAGSLIQTGASSQIIPEFTLQEGLTNRFEGMLRFPLLRFQPDNGAAFFAGGELAMGGKYLLVGGPGASATISIQGVIEAPTGNSRVVGNATQVMPTLLADWRSTRRLTSYTNLNWDSSFGGTAPRLAIFSYATALAFASPQQHLIPVLEFSGSTNTNRARTQGEVQPEVLFRKGTHLELKLGMPVGVNSISPTLGIHAQLALFWGKGEW